MNPFKLIARMLAPVHEPKGYQPKAEFNDGIAILPPDAQVVEVKRYPEAELIAASLRDFPGDWVWEIKGHTLKHTPTGFVLWVANDDYGLGERSHGRTSKFSAPEQAIIWPAVEAWLASHKVGFTGRLPKVKIWHQAGVWRCMSLQHPWAGAGDTPDAAYRAWAMAVSLEARTDQRPGEILHVWSAAR
ncbi:hypothetical protein IRZ81_10890 [Pseudomonas putida]|uniref:hypothetical protein n=1 Tax=Pseudomonas putida TaxID=303 RepID=UPI0018A98A62|nr:hypothetical protein [Pseudomonas putida]MBF8651308.1 hypothetical protein [Pseudomonas putida]MBF8655004.1 hypothetical protein [Pseudomonas putida]